MKTLKENGWTKDGIVWFLTVDGKIRGSIGHIGNGTWHGNYYNLTGTLISIKKPYPNVTSAKRAVQMLVKVRRKK